MICFLYLWRNAMFFTVVGIEMAMLKRDLRL